MAFALVLIGSLGIRMLLWLHRGGPLWFEEAVPVAWAQRLWGFERGHLDLNPHSALWPHLAAYVFFLVQLLHYAVGFVTGEFRGLADFRAAAFLDPEMLRQSAMLGEIVIGLCAIVAAARLAMRLAGPWLGIATAFVLAVEPLDIRYSLVPGPDMLLTLFVTLGLLAAMDVLERGRRRDSVLAGLFTGLGMATKYSPALLLVPLAVAHASSPGRARGVRYATCVVVAMATFAATSPFSWIDFGKRPGELGAELRAFVHGPFGASGHPAALTYALGTLPHDLGWPLALLLAAALIASLVRPSRPRAVLLAYVLPLAVVLGAASSAFDRYLLPIVPVLLVVAASHVCEAQARPSLRGWIPVLAAAGRLGVGWTGLQYVREALVPDSRSLARGWIVAHLAPGSLVALEPLGPELQGLDEQMETAQLPGLSPGTRARLDRAPAFSLAPIPMSVHDPDASSAFYDLRDLDGFDAVVVSGSVRGRYLAEPGRFAVQADFYEGLDRFWNVIYRTPRRAVGGPEILVYGADSARAIGLAAWWVERSRRHAAPLRQPPDDLFASVFARRALCLTRAGRFAQALLLWPTALSWAGAPGQWWYGQGLALAGTGDRHHAFHALHEANRRDPTLVDAGLLAAELALADGAVEESRQLLQELVARDGLGAEVRARADALARTLAARPAGGRP